MVVTLLTQTGGILGPIISVLGLIMNGIYEFFHLFGIQNIALTIIIFTFITKTLMLPLTIKQQKFTRLSSRMNPELQKITAKYKGKKDEVSLKKQQAETQAIYQKYGASPTSGCLPLLITLPIMFALYRVIYNIPAYVSQVKQLYVPVAEAINNVEGFAEKLAEFNTGIGQKVTEFPNLNKIIDVLANFKTEHWTQLEETFPSIQGTISEALPNIQNVNNFFGLNILDAPGLKFPAIIIPILAMALQFVQGKQLEVKNKEMSKGNKKDSNPATSAMSSMTVVMPIMSGFFCISFPIGIGLYWIATSVFSIVQQFFVNKYLDRINVDELIQKSVAKANKKKARGNKVLNGTSLQELASKQTRSIERTVTEKKNSLDVDDIEDKVDKEESVQVTDKKNQASPSSITEIANLLKSRNNEKGDK